LPLLLDQKHGYNQNGHMVPGESSELSTVRDRIGLR